MKIVVTGGTGFIGRRVVERLVERGDDVTVLTRNSTRASTKLPTGLSTLDWSPPDVQGEWVERVKAADAVINLAGEPVADKRWTAAQKHRILASRVEATTAIVAAMEQAPGQSKVLVNGSAIGFYGPRGDEILTEDSGPGSDFLAGVVKDWEGAAVGAEAHNVRVVRIRTGIVLGTTGGALPRLVFPFKVFAGGIMGPSDQWISWIHIEDEVGLILAAIDDSNATGPINATAPNPVTMADFSRSIGQALGRSGWMPGVPAIMRLVLGERAEVVFASQRVLPAKAEKLGYQFQHADADQALRSLLVS